MKDRLKRVKLVLEDARSICDKLDMMIIDNDRIDQDEVDLINVIRTQIKGYDKLLTKVLADDIIDQHEAEEIRAYEQRIDQAVQEQIREDGVISHSENQMVKMFYDCLKSLKNID